MTERERIADMLMDAYHRAGGDWYDITDTVLTEISAAEQRGAESMRERCADLVRDCSCPDCDGKGYVSVAAERKRYDCGECGGTGTLHPRSDIEARIRALAVPSPATDAGEKETAP